MAYQQKAQECITRRTLHNAVLSPIGSKVFLKKLVPMTIASILHQRMELDATDFATCFYGAIKYQAFKQKLRNPTLQGVKNWLNGAMDALEKNYLREMYLIFDNKNNPGEVFESYKLQFKYMGTDVISLDEEKPTQKILDESTKYILTAVQSLNSHNLFKGNEIELRMLLTYYDDVTPATYQPAFFGKENAQKVLESVAKQPSEYVHLGFIKTGHHILKCRGKGEVFCINRSMSSTNISHDNGNETQLPVISEIIGEYQDSDVEIIEPKDTEPILIVEDVQENIINETISHSNFSDAGCVTVKDKNFNCLCKLSTKVDHIDTILCSVCCKFQHCACLGYLQGIDVPDKYVCLNCDTTKDANEKEKQEKLAIIRLFIAFAYFAENIPKDVINILPRETADYTLNKLLQLQILLEDSDGKFSLNMELIINKYLEVLFIIPHQTKKKIRKSSMNFESEKMSQESMVLGGEPYRKKWKRS